MKTFSALWAFRVLVYLEASRLEDQGDLAGAWNWYRASLRTIYHAGMHSDVYRRNFIQRQHRELHNRILICSDDRRTTREMLRRAIDDVVACEQLAGSEQDSLKVGYVEVMAMLDGPHNPGHQVPLMRFRRFWNPDYQLTPEQIQSFWDAWRFVHQEPERSRRVLRLLTANWLTYLEQPEAARPKPDPTVASFDVYRFGDDVPTAARAISPEALDGWFDTAYDAQQALPYLHNSGNQASERANHADFLILLATELYQRDHGSDPPSYDALIGPYLKSLPAEILAKKPPSSP